MISMSLFLSIRALHEEGLGNKAIARRLDVDVRTVRKHVRRIAAGAREPVRAAVSRKLEPFEAIVEAKVGDGLSASRSTRICAPTSVSRPPTRR